MNGTLKSITILLILALASFTAPSPVAARAEITEDDLKSETGNKSADDMPKFNLQLSLLKSAQFEGVRAALGERLARAAFEYSRNQETDQKKYRLDLFGVGGSPGVFEDGRPSVRELDRYFVLDLLGFTFDSDNRFAYSPALEFGAQFRVTQRFALAIGARGSVSTVGVNVSDLSGVVTAAYLPF